MKILMFHGRAGGHNILPFLEYFNASTEHELTFIYSNDRTYFPAKENIKFVRFSFAPLRFSKVAAIIRGKYDLIWYHGGHSALIFFLFALLRRRSSTFIFNVWNEWLIHKAKKGGLKGKMFRYGIEQADIIHCNWHGTAEVLAETGWNQNIKVFYWGLQEENFKNYSSPEKEETSQFIDSLPAGKTKFFFPKSISPNSRHDLIIEAAAGLRQKGISNFVVYFWMGNTNNPELINRYRSAIQKYGLQEQVILQEHGFLPFRDLQLIWKSMDVGLQIAANEQLSTTFLEPLFYKKPIIVTDIQPYRLFRQKFGSDIVTLTALTREAIQDAMEDEIKGKDLSAELLDRRHQVVRENFNLAKNIRKIVEHYQDQARG